MNTLVQKFFSGVGRNKVTGAAEQSTTTPEIEPQQVILPVQPIDPPRVAYSSVGFGGIVLPPIQGSEFKPLNRRYNA